MATRTAWIPNVIAIAPTHRANPKKEHQAKSFKEKSFAKPGVCSIIKSGARASPILKKGAGRHRHSYNSGLTPMMAAEATNAMNIVHPSISDLCPHLQCPALLCLHCYLIMITTSRDLVPTDGRLKFREWITTNSYRKLSSLGQTNALVKRVEVLTLNNFY